MFLCIRHILGEAPLALAREKLTHASWADGRITAGHQSGTVKRNRQLAEGDPLAGELRSVVLQALEKSSEFFAAALPHRIFPPLFNCYSEGQSFGAHIDNAIRYDRTTQVPRTVRTDLSATLFLSGPDEYDGGELVIEDAGGERCVKLAAGDLALYPANSIHRVTPVTRGCRLASFFWIQSLVRDTTRRELLFRLDSATRNVIAECGNGSTSVELVDVYHNLLRQWAEV